MTHELYRCSTSLVYSRDVNNNLLLLGNVRIDLATRLECAAEGRVAWVIVDAVSEP